MESIDYTEMLQKIIDLLTDIKEIGIYGISALVACFSVMLIADFAKRWKA